MSMYTLVKGAYRKQKTATTIGHIIGKEEEASMQGQGECFLLQKIYWKV